MFCINSILAILVYNSSTLCEKPHYYELLGLNPITNANNIKVEGCLWSANITKCELMSFKNAFYGKT